MEPEKQAGESTETQAEAESRPVGRPPVLDDYKKSQICTILGAGCSRYNAARYVGCTPRTIRETAYREPEFAAALHQAEVRREILLLQDIRNAGKKSWRAAAWLLKRLNKAGDFDNPRPDCVSPESVKRTLSHFADLIVDAIPDDDLRDQVMDKMRTAYDDLHFHEGKPQGEWGVDPAKREPKKWWQQDEDDADDD